MLFFVAKGPHGLQGLWPGLVEGGGPPPGWVSLAWAGGRGAAPRVGLTGLDWGAGGCSQGGSHWPGLVERRVQQGLQVQ